MVRWDRVSDSISCLMKIWHSPTPEFPGMPPEPYNGKIEPPKDYDDRISRGRPGGGLAYLSAGISIPWHTERQYLLCLGRDPGNKEIFHSCKSCFFNTHIKGVSFLCSFPGRKRS